MLTIGLKMPLGMQGLNVEGSRCRVARRLEAWTKAFATERVSGAASRATLCANPASDVFRLERLLITLLSEKQQCTGTTPQKQNPSTRAFTRLLSNQQVDSCRFIPQLKWRRLEVWPGNLQFVGHINRDRIKVGAASCALTFAESSPRPAKSVLSLVIREASLTHKQ